MNEITNTEAFQQQQKDYSRVASALQFLVDQQASQPTLDDVANHVHLSSAHFQRLFKQWVGVSPKRYLQSLTLFKARLALQQQASLEQSAAASGLSGTARLHDHFVQLQAMTPAQYKNKGLGLDVDYGVVNTLFGQVFVALTARGICQLVFTDSYANTDEFFQLLPSAIWRENEERVAKTVEGLFRGENALLDVPSTNFQFQVWRALLSIPHGAVWSYSQLAAAMGKPNATRAVASAVAANPVAFLIPCHRVVRATGEVGQYRWQSWRKNALLAWEAN